MYNTCDNTVMLLYNGGMGVASTGQLLQQLLITGKTATLLQSLKRAIVLQLPGSRRQLPREISTY